MKITKNTTLDRILKVKGAEEILQKYGLPCLGCPMAQYEITHLKLGEVCRTYGLDADKILKDLAKIQE